VGQGIGGHLGEIEELRIIFNCSNAVIDVSILGLVPALRRLKVIRFDGGVLTRLSSQEIGYLSGIAADCDTLEEFGYNLVPLSTTMPTDDFKAICQVLSKFPNLNQVGREHNGWVDLCEESRFGALLEMVKTNKTIEQVPLFSCQYDEEIAAIKLHCHNNTMHNRIELIRKKGLLVVTVPSSSAWPLILQEFSGMPDVIYYLLQQQHGAMIGPTFHGCKWKQDFD
jgi:hypothetical protein